MEEKLVKMAVLAILLAVALPSAGQGYSDGFSDQEDSLNNSFSSGKLDLKMGWSEWINGTSVENQSLTDNPGPIFNVTDIQPGSQGSAAVNLQLLDNPGWTWIDVEQEVSDGNLTEYLDILIWNDNGNGIFEDEKVVFNGSLSELNASEPLLLDGEPDTTAEDELPALEDRFAGIRWELNTSMCKAQNRREDFDISFNTEQSRNNAALGTINGLFTDIETSFNNVLSTGDFSSCQVGECGSVLNHEDEGEASVMRIEENGNTSVTYTTILDSMSSVKFEDVEKDGGDSGLGEEGDVETDRFNVTVEDGHDFLVAKTKAGQHEGKALLNGEEDTETDSTGLFKIETVEITENSDGTKTYVIDVTSDGEEGRESPALSYVKFKFCRFNFQADLVKGKVIHDLGETTYHEENRMIMYSHGDNFEGLIEPAGTPEQPENISGKGFSYNTSSGEIDAEFEVEGDERRNITFAVYLKPFEGWKSSRADEQMLFNHFTERYGPGDHEVTLEVPRYSGTDNEGNDGDGKPENPGGGPPGGNRGDP